MRINRISFTSHGKLNNKNNTGFELEKVSSEELTRRATQALDDMIVFKPKKEENWDAFVKKTQENLIGMVDAAKADGDNETVKHYINGVKNMKI